MALDERLAYARQVVGTDPVSTLLGIQVVDVDEGRATVSLAPQAHHLNSLGRVHGSTLYALADQAMAVAANTLENPALMVETHISFLAKAEPEQRLLATARRRDAGRKLSLWEVEIKDEGGRLVALATGRGYHSAGAPLAVKPE
ncbi:MAG: PaaI family thioesterase [Desulfarculus sp.]|nr:PaaI family thioesterase [Pseudomonadota bacterium]MBV1717849.1 PaaI family thioesterase [Desulfarculus sp.]MBU4576585.1 PaaI family thioesterase [Pseudomonadota bacterium]MBU4596847.1 PaaI family thioesterase [Pseudomonadota bacterium]MBV1738911.1 PaaI family thioesterase [Desulfarculus sp.]